MGALRRRSRARLAVVALGLAATSVFSTSPAHALSAWEVRAGDWYNDGHCPANYYVCAYKDNGFNSYQGEWYYNGWGCAETGGSYLILWTTKTGMSAIRNRTDKAVFLWDSSLTHYIRIPAYSEYSQLGTTFGSYWNDRAAYISYYSSCPNYNYSG